MHIAISLWPLSIDWTLPLYGNCFAEIKMLTSGIIGAWSWKCMSCFRYELSAGLSYQEL